jgi:hypothetical protein
VRRTSAETSQVKYTAAVKRKMQRKVEEMKREQEIGKMTREKAAEENQIMGRIETIRT